MELFAFDSRNENSFIIFNEASKCDKVLVLKDINLITEVFAI